MVNDYVESYVLYHCHLNYFKSLSPIGGGVSVSKQLGYWDPSVFWLEAQTFCTPSEGLRNIPFPFIYLLLQLRLLCSSAEKVKELETLKSQIEEKDLLIHSTSARLAETEEKMTEMMEEADMMTAKLEEKEILLNTQIGQLQALENEVMLFLWKFVFVYISVFFIYIFVLYMKVCIALFKVLIAVDVKHC